MAKYLQEIFYTGLGSMNAASTSGNGNIVFNGRDHEIYVQGDTFKGTDTTYTATGAVVLTGTEFSHKAGGGVAQSTWYNRVQVDAWGHVISADTTDADTHWYSYLYATSGTGTANAAVESNPYLRLFENSTNRSTLRLIGGTGIGISSDANGNITFVSTTADTWRPIVIGNTEILGNGAGGSALTLKAGDNVQLTANGAEVIVSATDTVYTLPHATTGALGGVKLGYQQTNKNYPLLLDANDKAYVTVNWTDTDTWRPVTVNNTSIPAGQGLVLVPGSNISMSVDGTTFAVTVNNTYSYSLPAATSAALGGIKTGYSTTGKNYAVILDPNDKAYVAVDWTDTNTWRPIKVNGTAVADSAELRLTGGSGIVITKSAGSGYEAFEIANTYVYTLPVATSTALGGVMLGYATDAANRNYGVTKDASGNIYVNVPWTDTWRAVSAVSSSNTETAINTSAALKLKSGTNMNVVANANGEVTFNNTYSYSLPLAASGTRGGIRIGFTTNNNNRNYAVALDSEKAYVNVPWTDTWRPVSVKNGTTVTAVDTSASFGIKAGDNITVAIETDGGVKYAKITGTYAYALQHATSTALGGIKTGFDTSATARNYAVQLDANDKAYVNVPWVDTDTWRPMFIKNTAGTEYSIQKSADTSFGLVAGTNINITPVNASNLAQGFTIANTYSLPVAASDALGGIKIGFSTNATARNYAVQLSNQQAYVNVPWTDTHAVTKLVAGAQGASSTSTQQNPWLNLFDDTTSRGSFRLNGSQSMYVDSDSAGNLYFSITAFDAVELGTQDGVVKFTGPNTNWTLDARHTHSYSDLADIPAEFTPASHNHSAEDIVEGKLNPARIKLEYVANGAKVPVKADTTGLYVEQTDVFPHNVQLAIGHNDTTTSGAVLANPYLKLLDSNTRKGVIRFVGDDGIYVESGADGSVNFSVVTVNNFGNGTSDGMLNAYGPYSDFQLDFRHTHRFADLAEIPTTFTPAAHTHSASEIVSGTLSANRLPLNHVQSGTYYPVRADADGQLYADVAISASTISDSISAYPLDIMAVGGTRLYTFNALQGNGQIQLGTNMTGSASSDRVIINSKWDLVTTAASGIVPSIPVAGASASAIASQDAHWVLAAAPGGSASWMKLPTSAFTPAGWTLKKNSSSVNVTASNTVTLGSGLNMTLSGSNPTISADFSAIGTVGSAAGLAPAVAAGNAINVQTDLVLVSSGAGQTPAWKPLPATAFGDNPVSNVLSFQNSSGQSAGSFTANGENFTVKFAGSLSASLSNSVLTVTGATVPGNVSTAAAGIVPKIVKNTSGWNQTNDWVLISNNGGTPVWRPLPSTAFSGSSGGVGDVYGLTVGYGSNTVIYNPGTSGSALQTLTFRNGFSGSVSGTALTLDVNLGNATASTAGAVPALTKNNAAAVNTDWILVSPNGTTPIWKALPATALANTTYSFANLTVSGKDSTNAAVSMAYTPGGTSAQTAKTLEFDPNSMTVTSGSNKVTVAAKASSTVTTGSAGLAPAMRATSNSTKISSGMYVLAQSAAGSNTVNWYQLPDTAFTGGGGSNVVGRTLNITDGGTKSYVYNPTDGNSKSLKFITGLSISESGDIITVAGTQATTSSIGMMPAITAASSSVTAMSAQNNQVVLAANSSGVLSWMRLHANAFANSNTTYQFNSLTVSGTTPANAATSVVYSPGIASNATQTPFTLSFTGGLKTTINNQSITVESPWSLVTSSAPGIVPQITGGTKLVSTDNTAWVLTATGSNHSTLGWRQLPDTAWSAGTGGEQQSVSSVAFKFLSSNGTELMAYDPLNDTTVKSFKLGTGLSASAPGSDGIMTVNSTWQAATNTQDGYVLKTSGRSSTRITDSYYVLAHTGTNQPNWFRMPSNAFSNTTYSFADLTVSGTNSGGTTSSVVFTPGGTSAPTAKAVTFGSNMTVSLDSNTLNVNSRWDAAAYTTAGYIPAANTRTDSRVTDSYYILAQTGEAAPGWLKLPSNAFSNTTYTFGTLTMKKGTTSLVFTPNSTSRTLKLGANMTGSVSSNTFTINSKWDAVSSSAAGIVPAITNASDLAIDTSTDWVLVSAAGATPAWKRLPATAFTAGGSGSGVASKLYFQNNGGSNIANFDAGVATDKTLKAGSNINMTVSGNVVTINSKWDNVAAAAPGIVPSLNTKGSKAIDSSTADYVLTVNGSTVNWRLLPKAAFIETTGGGAGDLTAVLTYKDVNGSLQTYNPASGTDVDISAGIWYAKNAGDAATWNGKDQSWVIQTLADLTVSPTNQTGLLVENGTGTGKVTVIQNGAGTSTASQLKLRQDSSYLEWRNATGGTWSAWTKIKAGYADGAGSATSATRLAASRTISLTGAVTGSVSTDFSGNVDISTSFTSVPVNTSDTALQSMSGPLLATLFKSGSAAGTHVDVSANAVQAWNNTTASALYLNPKGGDVYVGTSKVLTESYAPTSFASSVTKGGARKPIWISSGTITEFDGSLGSANQPVYILNGSFTAGNEYVPKTGGTYSGDITVSNANTTATRISVTNTTANTGAKLWMWAGANGTANLWFSNLAGVASKSIVAIDAAGDATFNGNATTATTAATATTATKLSSGVGSNTQPIFIAADGTPTDSSANIGTNANTPMRLVNGVFTACNEYVPKTGGTFTGKVTNSNVNGFAVETTASNTEPKITVKAGDGSVGLIIGGSSRNKGLYDYGKSIWIVYSDSAGNVVLNGNAAGLAGGTAGSIVYQSAVGTTAFLPGATTNGHVLKYNTETNTPYWAADINQNTTNTAGATKKTDASLWLIGASTADSNTSEQTYKDTSISIKGGNLIAAGTVTAAGFTGALSGNASSASKFDHDVSIKLTGDMTGEVKTNFDTSVITIATTANHSHSDYVSQSATTDQEIKGTLILSKAQDLAGAANNGPALIVGGAKNAAHIEIDPNEIQAKSNGTTTAALYLNNDGGEVYINNSRALTAGNYTSYVKKIGTSDVGANLKPIYLAEGAPVAMSGNLGDSNSPIYISGGKMTACNEYVPKTGGYFSGSTGVAKGTNYMGFNGSTDNNEMWLYHLSSDHPNGKQVINVKLNGVTTFYGDLSGNATTATLSTNATKLTNSTGTTPVSAGSSDKPVYFNGGVPTAITKTAGGVNQAVYFSSGQIKEGNSFVPTTGGTFSGAVTDSDKGSAFIASSIPDGAPSWIQQSNSAKFQASGKPNNNSTHIAVLGQRTYDGWWTLGIHQNNSWYMTYVTEANRSAGSNVVTTQYIFNTDGQLNCRSISGTASAWTTGRKITLTGNASGSVTIKGNADVSLNVTNSYASSAGDSSKLQGFTLTQTPTVFNRIPYIGTDGVMEIGKYIDFHAVDKKNIDFSHRFYSNNDTSTGYTLTLPNANGTLALTSDITSAVSGFITKSGDTGIGRLTFSANQYRDENYAGGALHMSNGDITGINALVFSDYADDWSEGIIFKRSSSGVDSLYVQNGTAKIYKNGTSYNLVDTNNRSSYVVTNVASNGNYLRITGPFSGGYKDVIVPYATNANYATTSGSATSAESATTSSYVNALKHNGIIAENSAWYDYYSCFPYVTYPNGSIDAWGFHWGWDQNRFANVSFRGDGIHVYGRAGTNFEYTIKNTVSWNDITNKPTIPSSVNVDYTKLNVTNSNTQGVFTGYIPFVAGMGSTYTTYGASGLTYDTSAGLAVTRLNATTLLANGATVATQTWCQSTNTKMKTSSPGANPLYIMGSSSSTVGSNTIYQSTSAYIVSASSTTGCELGGLNTLTVSGNNSTQFKVAKGGAVSNSMSFSQSGAFTASGNVVFDSNNGHTNGNIDSFSRTRTDYTVQVIPTVWFDYGIVVDGKLVINGGGSGRILFRSNANRYIDSAGTAAIGLTTGAALDSGVQYYITSQTSKMYVVGSSGSAGNYSYLRGHSNFYFTSSAAFHASDRRKKENITDVREDILRLLEGPSGLVREFDWKETGEHKIGYIAQELAEVVPEVVDYDEETDVYSVDYNSANAAMVAALTMKVKEQDAQIKEQAAEMKTLRDEMAEMKKMLMKLMTAKD